MSVEDAELRAVLDRSIDECIQLRMGAQLSGIDASSHELLESLLDVRRRMDRVEELLATVLRLRGMAARRHHALRTVVEDQWDEAAVRQRQSAVRDEFSSAKERTAATNLEVLDARRLERGAGISSSLCDEAVDAIRLRLRGLSDVRQDITTVIKVRQFESSLDR